MFLKMLLGALFRQKFKHLVIAVTVALGVSLATAMLGVMFDVGDKLNQELKTYGANLVASPKGSSMLADLYQVREGEVEDQSFIKEDELYKIKMIFWAFNIVDFAPYLTERVSVGTEEFNLVGTWFNKHLSLPTGDEVSTGMTAMKSWWEIQTPGDDSDVNGVLVGRDLAEKLNLKVGDTFDIHSSLTDLSENLRVRDIFYSGGTEDGEIFAPLALVQNIAERPGLVQKIEISALTTPENELSRRAAKNPGGLSRKEWDTWYCTAYISSIAYQVEEILPGVRVKPVLKVAQSEGAILQKTQLMIVILTLLTLLCSALAISNLVTASIMERSVEIGLMKALGAGNFSVSFLILCEILVAALLGGVIGYGLGLGLARIIGLSVFGTAVEVRPMVIPLALMMVLVVTGFGSLPALKSLFRLSPTEVLHGR